MSIVNEKKIGKYILRVRHGGEPTNPREWDCLTKMICISKRYNLGDEHDYKWGEYSGWKDLLDDIKKKEQPLLIKPLFIYVHSGMTISTSPFDCEWDSWQIGWVIVTEKDRDYLGVPMDKIEENLDLEVREYDKFLRGESYYWTIEEIVKCNLGHEHEELVESVTGYNDVNDAMNEAMNYLSAFDTSSTLTES